MLCLDNNRDDLPYSIGGYTYLDFCAFQKCFRLQVLFYFFTRFEGGERGVPPVYYLIDCTPEGLYNTVCVCVFIAHALSLLIKCRQ